MLWRWICFLIPLQNFYFKVWQWGHWHWRLAETGEYLHQVSCRTYCRMRRPHKHLLWASFTEIISLSLVIMLLSWWALCLLCTKTQGSSKVGWNDRLLLLRNSENNTDNDPDPDNDYDYDCDNDPDAKNGGWIENKEWECEGAIKKDSNLQSLWFEAKCSPT